MTEAYSPIGSRMRSVLQGGRVAPLAMAARVVVVLVCLAAGLLIVAAPAYAADVSPWPSGDDGTLTSDPATLTCDAAVSPSAEETPTQLEESMLSGAAVLDPVVPSVRVEEASSFITYDGEYVGWGDDALSGGSSRWLGAPGSISIQFDGVGFDWITCLAPDCGIAKVSVDGGALISVDLYAPTLQFQQSVFSTSLLAMGAHRVVIAWTGTKNPASTGDQIGVDCLDIAGTPTAPTPLTRHDETDPHLAWMGTWRSYSDAGVSDQACAWTNSAGSYVDISFVGTSFAWLTALSAAEGVAEVTIDGSAPVTVNLYSSAVIFQQEVFARFGLSYGVHSVRIRSVGSRHVGLDVVKVDGPLVMPLVQEGEARVVKSGSWTTWIDPRASSGVGAYAATSGAFTDVTFAGTRLDWITATNLNCGVARIIVDGVDRGLVDLFSTSLMTARTMFTTGDLSDGIHNVRIAWTGTKNPASAGTAITIDAFRIAGVLAVRVEENSPTVTYSGSYFAWGDSRLSGSASRWITATRSIALEFDGTRLDWITCRAPDCGIANVSVDGRALEAIDLYASTLRFQQLVFSTGDLSVGQHRVVISWTGTRNPAATKDQIGLDRFDVVGRPKPPAAVVRVEENTPYVAYDGSFLGWGDGRLSGGSSRWFTEDRSAAVEFSGTRLDWISCLAPDCGIATVTIDGGDPVEVDLYASALQFQQLVYSTGALSPGKHRVVISWTGTRNADSSGAQIGFDRFDVVGAPISRAIKIFLDPGHGGHDPGAVDGTQDDALYTEEKSINLAIALQLRAALLRCGFEVMMSRTGDTYPTLDERAAMANSWGADALICMHSNAATATTPRGIEVFYGTDADKALADKIYPHLEAVSPWSDRGVKLRDTLRVLAGATMPAALIEYGFITNPQEEAVLVNAAYQIRMAEATCSGVLSWIGF